MATRNEVLTLFGATPEQIIEKQRREQAAMVLSQRDPFQRAGSAVGVGLARLFGGESADVQEARRLQGAREGIDLTTAEGMEAAAKRLQELGFEDRALQILDMASRKRATEQTQELAQIEIINKQVPVTVTTTDQFGDPKSVTVKISVPHKFNVLTDELTPIFDEAELQEQAKAQIEQNGVTTPDGPEDPRDRARRVMLERIDRIPVGSVENIDGTYIRRTGPGPKDVEIVPIEEVRAMPTELGNIGGA